MSHDFYVTLSKGSVGLAAAAVARIHEQLVFLSEPAKHATSIIGVVVALFMAFSLALDVVKKWRDLNSKPNKRSRRQDPGDE